VPCEIGLLRISKGRASFHEFADYERLVEMARADGWTTTLLVLVGGETGLRCGEKMALEWSDVDVGKRQLCVARSEWKGHITATKGGRGDTCRSPIDLGDREELTRAARHGNGRFSAV
jgi:integrase